MARCPDKETIHDYLLGNLPDESFANMDQHLSTCEACQDTVKMSVDDDTFVASFHKLNDSSSSKDVDFESEEFCSSSILRIEELVRDAAQHARERSPDSSALPIQTIREYRILKKLGQGGMGAVYEALHTKLDKLVAIKVLPHDRLNKPDVVARFEREMRAVGKLDHPNIIKAHDAGEFESQHYLVMEHVDGADLSVLLRSHGPFRIADACESIRQAADGLHHAHSHSMIHRDIKPPNIMLTRMGQVKILDLGLARLSSLNETGEDELTMTGQVMGTVDYMSPEQANGNDEMGDRSDVYSLGASLYKLLFGNAPFARPELDTVTKRLVALATQEVPAITDKRQDVPADLVMLIGKMLHRDPAQRPGADEVAKQLTQFTDGHNLSALFEIQSADETDHSLDATYIPATSTQVKHAANVASDHGDSPPTTNWALVLGGFGAFLLLATIITIKINLDKDSKVSSVEVKVDDQKTNIPIEIEQEKKNGQGNGDNEIVKSIEVQIAPDQKPTLTADQKAYLAAAKKLNADQLPASLTHALNKLFFFGGEVVINDEQTTATISASGFNQLWPLLALENLESLDVSRTSVTDLSLLSLIKLKHLKVQHAAYNVKADAILKSLPDLETVNGLPVKDYLADRAAMRKQIDELAEAAKVLPVSDVIVQVNQLLGQLHPEGPSFTLISSQATGHNAIGYTKHADGFFMHARFCGGLRDLSPLRALPFSRLSLSGTKVTDLSPLEGLPLVSLTSSDMVADLSPLNKKTMRELSLSSCNVSSLQSIQAMQLSSLALNSVPVTDLSPLSAMPLESLSIRGCPVSDLSPLKGMSIRNLDISSTPISNIGPLANMPLQTLRINKGDEHDNYRWREWGDSYASVDDLSPLPTMDLKHLSIDYSPDQQPLLDQLSLVTINGLPVEKFYRAINKKRNRVTLAPLRGQLASKGDVLSPTKEEQNRFLSFVSKLPAKDRNEAVASRIAELANEEMEFTRTADFALELVPKDESPKDCVIDAWSVSQIWPLAALDTLETVDLRGASVTDFRPLESLPVRDLKVDAVLFNVEADDIFEKMQTLQTINGLPKQQYLSQRVQMRKEIDDFAQPAKSLAMDAVFQWVGEKLTKLNPGYGDFEAIRGGISHGRTSISLDGGQLTILYAVGLRDLSPLRVLEFQQLLFSAANDMGGPNLYDLSPLKGLPITHLSVVGVPLKDLRAISELPLELLEVRVAPLRNLDPVSNLKLRELRLLRTLVSDLTPLAKMPLEKLDVSRTQVSDLTPLNELELKEFTCVRTNVSNIAPLAGLPLKSLSLTAKYGPHIASLKPLKDLPLESLEFNASLYRTGDQAVVRNLPLKKINRVEPSQFWAEIEKRKKEHEEFFAAVGKLPIDQQMTRVIEKIKAPDVNCELVQSDGKITEASINGFGNHRFTELWPLIALKDLKVIKLSGLASRTDLGPLLKLQIEELTIDREHPDASGFIEYNLPVIQSLPSLKMINGKPKTDAKQ